MAAADVLMLDLTMGLYETTDAHNAIPKVGAVLAEGKPLPNVKFIGS